MAFDHMLDDGKAEPGPTRMAAARGIDPVESLRQPGEMLARYALPLVRDADLHPIALNFGPKGHHRRPGTAAVADCVGQQIVEDLHKLWLVAADRRKIGRHHNLDAAIGGAGHRTDVRDR